MDCTQKVNKTSCGECDINLIKNFTCLNRDEYIPKGKVICDFEVRRAAQNGGNCVLKTRESLSCESETIVCDQGINTRKRDFDALPEWARKAKCNGWATTNLYDYKHFKYTTRHEAYTQCQAQPNCTGIFTNQLNDYRKGDYWFKYIKDGVVDPLEMTCSSTNNNYRMYVKPIEKDCVQEKDMCTPCTAKAKCNGTKTRYFPEGEQRCDMKVKIAEKHGGSCVLKTNQLLSCDQRTVECYDGKDIRKLPAWTQKASCNGWQAKYIYEDKHQGKITKYEAYARCLVKPNCTGFFTTVLDNNNDTKGDYWLKFIKNGAFDPLDMTCLIIDNKYRMYVKPIKKDCVQEIDACTACTAKAKCNGTKTRYFPEGEQRCNTKIKIAAKLGGSCVLKTNQPRPCDQRTVECYDGKDIRKLPAWTQKASCNGWQTKNIYDHKHQLQITKYEAYARCLAKPNCTGFFTNVLDNNNDTNGDYWLTFIKNGEFDPLDMTCSRTDNRYRMY
eukprot:Pgem_evm1s18630